METSWIKTWKQNPTTITNGHKTVKMALTKWNVSSVPRYAAHVIREKITSGKRDHGCGGFQINYKVGKSINCEKGMLICHTGEVSLHTLSLHFLPTLPLTPPSIFMHSPTQFYPPSLAPLSLHSLTPLSPPLTYSSTHSLHSFTSLSPQFTLDSLSPFTDTALSLFTHSILFSLHP